MQQPQIVETIAALRSLDQGNRTIGLVPTMGALHAGHGALIDKARSENDRVVVSIFVNPKQFDRPDDYAAYAIDLPADRDFCAQHHADIIFAPAASEIYPPGHATYVEVLHLTDHLCGKFRPGHFRGVATVVLKLLNIVAPHRAYFGEKDAQQLAVISRMTQDLNLPVEIVSVPTVREPDGLALSSRNRRLTPQERKAAPALYQALQAAAKQADPAAMRKTAQEILAQNPQIRVEYLEVVDAATMTPIDEITHPARIAAAIWLGNTRLIDNLAI